MQNVCINRKKNTPLLGQELKEYRKKKGLSQSDLAEKLDVSQVHVSRIENRGGPVSARLYSKIAKLANLAPLEPSFKGSVFTDKTWRFCRFAYPDLSGDYVSINSKSFQNKSVAVHSDSAGSDLTAAHDAELLQVAVESALAGNSELRVTPESVLVALNQTYRNTRNLWRAEPSINLFFMNKKADSVLFLGAGMPPVYVYRSAENSLTPVIARNWPPVGRLDKDEPPVSCQLVLAEGDMLFSFSDGFLEEFRRSGKDDLEVQLRAIAKAQRSDVEGVGAKLLRALQDRLRNRRLIDDISFLIVSRG